MSSEINRRDFVKLSCLGVLGSMLPNHVFAQEDKRKEFVKNARKYLDTPYFLGGRLTKKNPGLDCMGLIFRAYSNTYRKPWTKLSVLPSELIKEEQLGKPVGGLDGVLNEDVDFSKFEEGDIIHLIYPHETLDNPSVKIEDKDYWTWHMGIYSDKKRNLFLDALPKHNVREYDFNEAIKETPAIFVTRFNL